VPAKYKKRNTRTNYKKYENSNRTTGMSWKYCTFNLGYASQHSHGKKTSPKNLLFRGKTREEKNRNKNIPGYTITIIEATDSHSSPPGL
jgi:hypothetical protein